VNARKRRIAQGEPFAWRLDVEAAMARVDKSLSWKEFADESLTTINTVPAEPLRWGDVILARRDIPTSYHLAVVLDDALQGTSHIVRGRDLFLATSVQRLLQELLGLPQPAYFHHPLILGADGRKLSKSFGDTSLAALRDAGMSPEDVKARVGL
jgi:glutamyl-Q tRNA(Asp) synthetase